jgi:hypothetical protein
MLSQLVAVSGYIVASRAALGPDDMVARAQTDQLQNLIRIFGRIRPTTDDAQATLSMLADPEGAPGFTADQKRELARAVMMASNNIGTTSLTVSRAQPQHHMHLFNYLTRSDWDTLRSPVQLDDKFSVMANRSLAIGLLHPCERTNVCIVSIVAVAGQYNWLADESLQYLNMFKRLMKLKRTSVAGLVATFSDFPADVANFTALHNNRYDIDNMPVPSPFLAASFEERRLVTAARKSHKSVFASGPKNIGSGLSSSGSNPLQEMLMGCIMNQIMPSIMTGSKPGGKTKEIPITFTCSTGSASGQPLPIADTPHPPVIGATLALEDERQQAGLETPVKPTAVATHIASSPAGGIASTPLPGGGSPMTVGIDDMIREMQSQIAENNKSKKDTKSKTAGAKKGDTVPKAAAKTTSKLPKKKSKRSVTKAAAKAAAKAVVKAKAKAKATSDTVAPAKPKTADTAAGKRKLVLGCSKCRGIREGCAQCRDPKFAGRRGPR